MHNLPSQIMATEYQRQQLFREAARERLAAEVKRAGTSASGRSESHGRMKARRVTSLSWLAGVLLAFALARLSR